MKVLFWIGVGWLVYVYVGYPLILAVLARIGRRIHPVIKDDYLPSVSVLVSARNEEKDIGWKVAETLAWDYPRDRLEVLVASDASDDRTDEILQGIKDPRLKLVRMEKRSGKGVALNRLAQLAQGEILFFTDANARIPAHCLRRVARHFADERVGCVTGDADHLKGQGDSSVAKGTRAYWGYETLVKYLENQIGSVLVCVGRAFATRRSNFEPLQADLANDLELPMRIAHAGYWIRYEPEARSVEGATSSPSEEFARQRRIVGQGALAVWRLRSLLKGLRGWQFFSRKALRWLTLVPLALVLISSLAFTDLSAVNALLLVQLLFYGLALAGGILVLLGRSGGPVFSVPFYILLIGAAGITGIFDTCRGQRFNVWEIPTLSRRGGDLTAAADGAQQMGRNPLRSDGRL
jgi:cellulose synthase/poly-beta-1,6-N-acetylglucosamine synthase-like glycosyltransferase